MEGKCLCLIRSEGGNWRKESVASTLTLPQNMVYPALLPLTRTPRLPIVDWIDAPASLNGLVRFAERRNLVSARVPLHFKRSVLNSLNHSHSHPTPPALVLKTPHLAHAVYLNDMIRMILKVNSYYVPTVLI